MLEFIAETLKIAARAVSNVKPASIISYTDVKGYLAEADMVAHDVVTNAISSSFPRDLICSEENSGKQKIERHQKGSQTWVLDPICGTTNYIRHIPLFTHSLCVMDDEGVKAAGIYNPAMDELFLADRSKTALNDRVVRVSEVHDLVNAVISVNCNQSVCKSRDVFKKLLGKLAPPTTCRLRIFESANLELAYVACGRLDGYVNPDDKVWDLAAGSLMVTSAGGVAHTCRGSVYEFSEWAGVVAGNRHLINQLESLVRKEIST